MLDDLNTPLRAHGKRLKKSLANQDGKTLSSVAYAIMFGGLVTLGWIASQADPLGGQPYAIVSLDDPRADARAGEDTAPATIRTSIGHDDADPESANAFAANQQTAQQIDRSEIRNNGVAIIHRPGQSSSLRLPVSVDPDLLENGPNGPLPRIADDGRRPSHAYARPTGLDSDVQNPGQARIAVVVSGLGISASGTIEAIQELPGQMTLAFAPYGSDLQNWVAKARRNGHEVLMQIPMEPFDYPDNDPGPHTLRVGGDSRANIDRLHWLMARFTGYVGITNYMGARFTANSDALEPVLREVSDRGLIYFDDNSSPRSQHKAIAPNLSLQSGTADVAIDAVHDRENIDAALKRLENLALRHGLAVGYATALPITLERLSEWSKELRDKGITLIPLTAALREPAQS